MINYNLKECLSITQEKKFGICDDNDKSPAYINSDNEKIWIAHVKNEKELEIQFTAIDNCIKIKKENGDDESSCDGMLRYNSNIVFVELKNKRKSWITDGAKQLLISIKIFFENNEINMYKKKMAFLCNSQHPHFHYGHQELMQKFSNETNGVRLVIDNIITLK